MKKLTMLLLTLLGIAAPAFPGNVLLNQVGYMPQFPKFVFATAAADSFFIRQASTDNIIFRGKLALWKLSDPSTGLDVYKGDFSSFKTPGEYYISTSASDKSANFTISDSVYVDPYYKILKSFY
ncbi:MAG: cellulase N-terminal Ig-like domain-containing protein, partial [Syntrophothermus sp.]